MSCTADQAAAAASRRQRRTFRGKKGAGSCMGLLLCSSPFPATQLVKMKAMTAALLLGALFLLSAAHARETKWCAEQREQCEDNCPKDSKVDFK